MQRQVRFALPDWLAGMLAIGLLIGAIVAVAFHEGKLSPEQTRTAVKVGIYFWIVTGLIFWGCRANIETSIQKNHNHHPELSTEGWRKLKNQESGLTKP